MCLVVIEITGGAVDRIADCSETTPLRQWKLFFGVNL